MAQIPSFFFSHARQDREAPGRYLSQFFEDLEVELANWVGHSIKDEGKLGTIDRRIEQGDNWDEILSGGLRLDKLFVAILTPLYFKRANCGKELGIFLLRSPDLNVNSSGALAGVKNVLLIRWKPEMAYQATNGNGTLIPKILNLIEDTPADDGRDEDRTRAIERYRRKGMENCIDTASYRELLQLFVARMATMAEKPLPPADRVSFEGAVNAFDHDWQKHFAKPAMLETNKVSATPSAVPQPLRSAVVFYLTRVPLELSEGVPPFAGLLISGVAPGATDAERTLVEQVLEDVTTAGVAEGISVFHAVPNSSVLTATKILLDQMRELSRAGILTALVLDDAMMQNASAPEQGAIAEVVSSQDWLGPVLVLGGSAQGLGPVGAKRTIVLLPRLSRPRVAAVRSALLEVRGQLLRSTQGTAPTSETLPLLAAVRS